MTSALSGIPIDRRRRLAATIGLFAVLCVTVGLVATTGRSSAAVRAFSSIALVAAGLLALISWGITHSIKIDLAEQRLDAAIDQAMAEHGGSGAFCGCGHDHDPTEMHVTDGRHDAVGDACAHDGHGTDCTHNCVSCVLRSLRPSPTQTREERLRASGSA